MSTQHGSFRYQKPFYAWMAHMPELSGLKKKCFFCDCSYTDWKWVKRQAKSNKSLQKGLLSRTTLKVHKKYWLLGSKTQRNERWFKPFAQRCELGTAWKHKLCSRHAHTLQAVTVGLSSNKLVSCFKHGVARQLSF